MKKVLFIITILFVAVFSTACINNMAVQELNDAAEQFMAQGNYDAAIERLESSAELDCNVYQTYYNLGVAYISAKKYDKAIDSLERAIKLNSRFANSYYSLAVAQENFADSIVEKVNNDSEAISIETGHSTSQTDMYGNLSNEDKENMIKYYLISIENYKKYMDITKSSSKTDEIQNHITDMEKVLNKLDYSGSVY